MVVMGAVYRFLTGTVLQKSYPPITGEGKVAIARVTYGGREGVCTCGMVPIDFVLDGGGV